MIAGRIAIAEVERKDLSSSPRVPLYQESHFHTLTAIESSIHSTNIQFHKQTPFRPSLLAIEPVPTQKLHLRQRPQTIPSRIRSCLQQILHL